MCRHKFIKINNVDVCVKCGLSVCDSKVVIIDRKLIGRIGKKVKK